MIYPSGVNIIEHPSIKREEAPRKHTSVFTPSSMSSQEVCPETGNYHVYDLIEPESFKK
ncbi:MAG: hypothetical protein JRJ65_02875 [Deltaproteobacteria bacterium]|nr:hypothetical protein [Deltaproteobacteria bacterium]